MKTPVDRLSVFAFLWACQALIHQEFYSRWIDLGDPLGWLVVVFALMTLLRPQSLIPLTLLAVASSAYNIGKWPFVVNHILVETIVNLAILSAVIKSAISDRGVGLERRREHIFDRFCPVLMTMLVSMYYFAFLAKLNRDFLDPEFSCVVTLYGDLVDRFPFMPTGDWTKLVTIWATIGIEFLIPVLLTFKRTRFMAITIGLPFHLMLGFIGHRTFSGLAYALYGLFLIRPLTGVVGEAIDWLQRRLGERGISRIYQASAVIVLFGTAILIASYSLGYWDSGIGPLKLFQIPWLVWISWSLLLMFGYGIAMVRGRSIEIECSSAQSARPGLVWLLMIVVFFNGTSQYLGLKTQTCFTMYSNLRTEGNINNHLFLPALRVADYQDDLIELVETDHDKLLKFKQDDLLITHFEFKRLVSEATSDFEVSYIRNGVDFELVRRDGILSDPFYAKNHTLLLRKLLFFRPITKGEHMRCLH